MRVLTVQQSDGSLWAVPVEVIARDRAKHYAKEFDGDVERSLAEDTLPLFAEDAYEVEDWAANNMNWQDVAHAALKLRDPRPPNFVIGWINGKKDVVDIEDPRAVEVLSAGTPAGALDRAGGTAKPEENRQYAVPLAL
jgi:hypothetical protein